MRIAQYLPMMSVPLAASLAIKMTIFTEHPQSIGETYTGHAKQACRFSMLLLTASMACLARAIFPFWFQQSGSRMVRKLHSEMESRNGSKHK